MINQIKKNKCYLLIQIYDDNENPIDAPKNKNQIGEEIIFIKELIYEKESIIDDKNKKSETIQIIMKEYYPKISLNPKVILN